MIVKPNTFIIGAPKCGTTALATYLAAHPNVFFSDPKEPHFWCSDFSDLRRYLRRETLNDYLQLFSQADDGKHKIVAEGSTRYLGSSVAVREILEFDAEARFIAMLRNPIEMVHACHMEQIFSFDEDIPDFEEAWRAQTDRAAGRRVPRRCREPHFLQYGDFGLIGRQLKNAMQLIPASQLHVIVFDDFKASPSDAYQGVLRFLKLSDDGRTDFPAVNSAHAHRFPWLANFILDPPGPIEELIDVVRRHFRRKRYRPVEFIKSRLVRKKRRKSLRPEFVYELKEYFAADVGLLSQLLNRDLMKWVG